MMAVVGVIVSGQDNGKRVNDQGVLVLKAELLNISGQRGRAVPR